MPEQNRRNSSLISLPYARTWTALLLAALTFLLACEGLGQPDYYDIEQRTEELVELEQQGRELFSAPGCGRELRQFEAALQDIAGGVLGSMALSDPSSHYSTLGKYKKDLERLIKEGDGCAYPPTPTMTDEALEQRRHAACRNEVESRAGWSDGSRTLDGVIYKAPPLPPDGNPNLGREQAEREFRGAFDQAVAECMAR